MTQICKETVGDFSKGDLLRMVKRRLDESEIPYKEEPGGFCKGKLLNPDVLNKYDSEILRPNFEYYNLDPD